MQGLAIQNNSSQFFANGSNPGGVLTAPGAINDETAKRLKDYWDQNFTGANVGKVAVLGDGLKYEAMIVNAVDAQLIEQLKWTAETVCSCFHVPSFMIGLGAAPHFATGVEPLLQLYY
jgi:HK97 family phage portal protein